MRAEPTPEAVRAAFERLGPVEPDRPQVYDDEQPTGEVETVTTELLGSPQKENHAN